MFQRDAVSVDVGARLKQLREQQEISMRRLAAKSGLSANALSMIERGKASPSVSTLYKLADALGVPITQFFEQANIREPLVLVKADARTRLPFQRGVIEGLGGERFIGRVSPFLVTLESGAGSGPHRMSHTGQEFVFCLRGQLEYFVDGTHYLLEAGDSLIFAASMRHSWRNPGGTVTNALIIISDYADSDRPMELHLSGELEADGDRA